MTRWSSWCLLLTLTLPVAWATPAAPPIDTAFEAFWRAAAGQPFVQQEQLWDRLIERPRQDIYASVVWEQQRHPDWRTRKQRLLRMRFAHYPQLAPHLGTETRELQAALGRLQVRFRQLFADAAAHPSAVIVLAPGFDAKSGVLPDGTPVLAFAVDSLLLERANLDIVVPHELFHLYHAQHAGIRNDGVMPGADLTLPLFEEGLATYVSGQLAPGYSDGALLLQDNLGAIPLRRLPVVARRFLVDAHAEAIDPGHPEAFRRWFNAAATPYQTDLPNRAGYWLGLQVIRDLRKNWSLAQIAAWSPAQAETRTLAALDRLSAGSR